MRATWLLLAACIGGCIERHGATADPEPDAIPVDALLRDAFGDAAPDAQPVPDAAGPCLHADPSTLTLPDTPVGDSVSGTVTLTDCGDTPVRVRAVRLGAQTDPAFTLGDLPPMPHVVAPGQALTATVALAPAERRAYHGTLVVELDDAVVTVRLNGRGAAHPCPVPAVVQDHFVVDAPDVVTLDGTPSTAPGGQIVIYRWVLTSVPEGAIGQPVESFVDPRRPQDGGPLDDWATPTALYFAPVPGDYGIELHVTDNFGLEAPSDACRQPVARVRIHAPAPIGLRVELSWNTPADLDLHLLHPQTDAWNNVPLDCYAHNPTPDWGVRNHPGDNPVLFNDETLGGTPEDVELQGPQDTGAFPHGYEVGVHLFADHMAPDGTDATVRVYLDGTLAYEKATHLDHTGVFWHAADVAWTAGRHAVTDVDQLYPLGPP